MSEKIGRGPGLVFVLKDGLRGHENQSAGISWWLRELGGSEIVEIDIPGLTGFERFSRLKIGALRLKSGGKKACLRWLEGSGGIPILESVRKKISGAGAMPNDVLFLSAGSSAAPWCLSLARVICGRCCTIMTPSVFGTKPFDFAIVPEHDFPKPDPDILMTLGAPNMIRPELLETDAALIALRFPSDSKEKWGVMIGGEDDNYTISPAWVDEVIRPLLEEAKTKGAEMYFTTSRRTLLETEERVAETATGFSNVRMLISGTKDPWNPVPGMLGLCSRIFCTEDSVSMISEAATADHVVNVLAVGRKKGLKRALQKITGEIIDKGLIDKSFYWGAPRFDLMIDSFCRRGLAVRVDAFSEKNRTMEPKQAPVENSDFNEAKRASEWIVARWNI